MAVCEARKRDVPRLVYLYGVGGVTGMGVSRDQISLLEYGTPAAISQSAVLYWGTGHPKALASADPGPAISGKGSTNSTS